MNTIINTKTTIIIITKKLKSEFVTQTNNDENGKTPTDRERERESEREGEKIYQKFPNLTTEEVRSVKFQFAQRLNFNFCARYCPNMHIKLDDNNDDAIFNYVKHIAFALLF